MTAELVRIRGVERSYADGTVALRGVDLDVSAGESLALIGRSGSGKSTLLNIIGLLDAPTAGTYELLGQDVSLLGQDVLSGMRATTIGFVFQAFHLLDHRTVQENVEIGALYLGWTRRERAGRARELLDRLGLAHRITAHPHTLSGGERQRVAIARSAMARPAMLLCDEPTGNLDTENAMAVLEVLLELNRSGTTLLIVTHDDQIARQADRLVRVSDGRLESPVPS